MVDTRIKNFRTKKDLLHSERTTNDERNRYADQLIEAERYGEALEFLEITRDAERLERVRADAVYRGDTFLLLRVERLRGEAIAPEGWREVADRAVSLGKYFDAYRALTKAGDEERAEALRAQHMPDYQPFRPAGK